LSKSEARRQDVVSKKLSALREKRAELDTQIESLEAELQELGAARMTDFQRERQEALQSLMVALAQHDAAIGAAGLDVRALLPEISPLLPELEAIARGVSEPRADA
jgi:DNA repair exonuclease SbcCD ATPase subunit